jgi:superfamily II DNA/RNA helicase
LSDSSFRALGLSAPVLEVLAERGFEQPFSIQQRVVPYALDGRDVLAKSPTGSGKTLAFALPVVERTNAETARPAVLVLVPTRELASQVAAEATPFAAAKGLRVATVYGGAPLSAQAKRARTAHVVVATPGRLQDLIERRAISLDHVRILVLDEADRMLDMGFRPQVERLLRRLPAERQTMLFSATLDGEVADLARAFTDDPVRVEAVRPQDVRPSDVEHRFVAVTNQDKLGRLVEELKAERDLALVFVRTKRGADRLARRLGGENIAAAALHGDMSQGARERALDRFRSGKVKTLVATDVAARGLDLSEITHVINFDPPADDKEYVHRVGRTGRAGRAGSGITFVLPEQQPDVSRVASRLGHGDAFERSGMRVAAPRRVYTSRRGRRSRW